MSREARERAAKGGRARASKLTPEERRRIGIAGSVARWGKKLPSVRYVWLAAVASSRIGGAGRS